MTSKQKYSNTNEINSNETKLQGKQTQIKKNKKVLNVPNVGIVFFRNLVLSCLQNIKKTKILFNGSNEVIVFHRNLNIFLDI